VLVWVCASASHHTRPSGLQILVVTVPRSMVWPNLQQYSQVVRAAHHSCCQSSCVPTWNHQPENQTCAKPEILSETPDAKRPVTYMQVLQFCLAHSVSIRDENPSALTPNCKGEIASMKQSKSMDAEKVFRFVTVQLRTGFRTVTIA